MQRYEGPQSGYRLQAIRKADQFRFGRGPAAERTSSGMGFCVTFTTSISENNWLGQSIQGDHVLAGQAARFCGAARTAALG
jgi:hypothetical protein